jgi:hypothetical protein
MNENKEAIEVKTPDYSFSIDMFERQLTNEKIEAVQTFCSLFNLGYHLEAIQHKDKPTIHINISPSF